MTMNLADNPAGAKRSFVVSVKVKDTFGRLSPATAVTMSNAPPATINVTANAGFQNNVIHLSRPTETDFAGYIVWGSTTSGFSLSPTTRLYEGPSDTFVHSGLTDSATWYYKATAYDVFGKDYTGAGLNVSAQISSTTSAGAAVNEYELIGVTWTPNSPSANSVSWTACTAIQTLGASKGSSWAVSAGSAAWTSGVLYIYYAPGSTTLSSTTSLVTATANVIVANYRGGTLLAHADGNAFIDGGMLIAQTVGATQVVTSGLITQSAQINNALIYDAHITGLLSAGKIDGTGLVIKDTSGNVILGSGTGLPLGYVPAGALNSGITMNSNGTLSGAGGGAVTPAGISAVGSGNPITSGNASTYIANAAIGSAQVGTITAGQVITSNLQALSANIGTLRTASSGARMEIQDNKIRIYDASNVLRVKIGDLS
jgi:hypothetical protein